MPWFRLTRGELLKALGYEDAASPCEPAVSDLTHICGGANLLESLPEEITASFFAEQVLGIEPGSDPQRVMPPACPIQCEG